MSRTKLRSVTEICADCGSLDPAWASINRGILVCDECCSIHRSLGRNVSQIKSLKKGSWNPTQLAMVRTLNSNGANSIWEHSLLDPSNTKSGRRKPQPKDPVHPTKAEFVRAKHQLLTFVNRPGKDDSCILDGDLSKQLHSSVRTSNLETSLRLLSSGADANYYHEEKGNCPLHVAAKAGQASQVELLVVYGADPLALDRDGKTPIDYARSAGYLDLADRLVECSYELTDRLAFFICGRKPDHQNGQHFIVPEMSDSVDMTELAKAAKRKLQSLPNYLFEDLAMDVYDEVDRREIESICSSMQTQSALGTDRYPVPFLPVSPELTSTRNQGRQKLARFNRREFTTLIIDILSDAKRRQSGSGVAVIPSMEQDAHTEGKEAQVDHCSTIDLLMVKDGGKSKAMLDDEPLYDSVASDEDYVLVGKQLNEDQENGSSSLTADAEIAKKEENAESSEVQSKAEAADISRNAELPCTEKSTSKTSGYTSIGDDSLLLGEALRKQLKASESKMDDLREEIRVLKHTVSQLLLDKLDPGPPSYGSQVQNLVKENTELRTIIQHAGLQLPHSSLHNGHEPQAPTPSVSARSPRTSQRPASMYEPREGLRGQQLYQSPNSGSFGNLSKLEDGQKRNPNDCDSFMRPVVHRLSSHPKASKHRRRDEVLPPAKDVVCRTDYITKCIQELWTSMQENKPEAFKPCAVKIQQAVSDLTAIFPQKIQDEVVATAINELNINTSRLQSECKSLVSENLSHVDQTYFLQRVRSCAYDIAKATKQLVTKFQC